jgi:hypothetical protein
MGKMGKAKLFAGLFKKSLRTGEENGLQIALHGHVTM